MRRSNQDESCEFVLTQKQLIKLRSSLLNWFDINGREGIPWKLKSDVRKPLRGVVLNPYSIWVAEVMLQQTQLKVVLPFWKKWMNVFPTVDDLVHSPQQEVLRVWQGLGYYARARRLQKASRILIKLIGNK